MPQGDPVILTDDKGVEHNAIFLGANPADSTILVTDFSVATRLVVMPDKGLATETTSKALTYPAKAVESATPIKGKATWKKIASAPGGPTLPPIIPPTPERKP